MIISFFTTIYLKCNWSLRGVVANKLDYEIIASDFDLRSR